LEISDLKSVEAKLSCLARLVVFCGAIREVWKRTRSSTEWCKRGKKNGKEIAVGERGA
jgi:hypothetical protein